MQNIFKCKIPQKLNDRDLNACLKCGGNFTLLFFDGYHISQVKCGNEITIWLLLIALQCGAQT